MLCIVYFSKFLIFFHQLLTAWLIALRRQVPGGGGAVHGRHCGRRRAVHLYVTLSHHIVFIYKIVFVCPIIIIITIVFIIIIVVIISALWQPTSSPHVRHS